MKLKIAVIGCGFICHQYAKHIAQYPDLLEIVGATDIDFSRTEAFCQEYGGRAYENLDAVLADPNVNTILNLTIHHAHFDINKRALEAGKHVYTEKPLALNTEQANELIATSERTGMRLAAAPITFLGEGIQTAAQFLKREPLGPVRLVYAEVNWGQIERWISSPALYYTVGPLLDVGVYAITALTYILGPVREVWGYSKILKKDRKDKDGKPFTVTAPDFTTGMMEFENGVVARLTTNYYVPIHNMRHLRGFEFHGDDGSFLVNDYHDFNCRCTHIPYKQDPVEVPLLREAKSHMDRALGLADLAMAISENRPHLCGGKHATHVMDIMESLQRSSDESSRITINSTFENVGAMAWVREQQK